MEVGRKEQQHSDEPGMEDPVAQLAANSSKSNAQEEDGKAKRVASLDIFRGLTVAVLSLSLPCFMFVWSVCALFWFLVLGFALCVV